MARKAKPWFCSQTGWWKVWINGRKVKLVAGRKNKKAAQEALDDLRFEARHNPSAGDPQQTIVSVIERYIEVVFPQLSERTAELRKSYLQSFSELHGWRLVKDARPDHLQEWINKHPEWASDWTKRDAVMAVQTVFNWAKPKIVKENPFDGVHQRPGLPRRDMTEEEFRAILRVCVSKGRKRRPTPAARFREVLFFLWLTGCRPKEASNLTWTDIDFTHNLILLKKHKTVRLQGSPAPRIIPLDPVVVRLLRHIQKRQEGERVFLTHRKSPWNRNSLALRIRRAREVAGVADDVKLYGARHAFGTRGIIAGCDIKTLSVLMGHTNTRMTEHYAHIAGKREFLAAAMQQINRRPAARRLDAQDCR